MKRNLISELQQRSRSTFLKCRAPYAAARSLAATAQSPPRGPPTAASPALWGAATPPSAPAQPHVAPPSAANPNHAGQVPWPPTRSSGRSKPPDRLLAALLALRAYYRCPSIRRRFTDPAPCRTRAEAEELRAARLKELVAKLSVTACKLPPVQDRRNAFQEIGRIRARITGLRRTELRSAHRKLKAKRK